MTTERVIAATPEVVQAVTMRPDGDPRKGYYGPDVELLLLSDGTVRWRYEGDDE